jgi:hypothetical protein
VVGFEPSALIDVVSPNAISPIDEPRFEVGASWLADDARVIVLEHGGIVRAYPRAILAAHEVVNDEVNGDRVAVTFSFLSGAAIVYRRSVQARSFTFAVSGKLYRSTLVLYDRETTTLWLQMDGRAVRGEMTGAVLDPLPSRMMTAADFRARFPAGRVLARPSTDDGTPLRTYDEAALERYADGAGPEPALLARALDGRMPAMERVIGVRAGGVARAYPVRALEARPVVEDTLAGRAFVLRWDGTGASVAAAGPAPPVAVEVFWFAWAAFSPDTDVWPGG